MSLGYYALSSQEQGVRVVQHGVATSSTRTLKWAFEDAKQQAGWGEGGTGLQQVGADVETSIVHAFRGLPSPPPRE